MLSLFPAIPVLMLLGLWLSKSTRQVRAVMVAGSSLLLALAGGVGFRFLRPRGGGGEGGGGGHPPPGSLKHLTRPRTTPGVIWGVAAALKKKKKEKMGGEQ